MAYVKQTWQTGEVITAEKLNHMENGIGNCVMVVNETTEDDTSTLSKTWQEIFDAMSSGKVVFLIIADEDAVQHKSIANAYASQGTYICVIDGNNYTTDAANGYPAYTQGPIG